MDDDGLAPLPLHAGPPFPRIVLPSEVTGNKVRVSPARYMDSFSGRSGGVGLSFGLSTIAGTKWDGGCIMPWYLVLSLMHQSISNSSQPRHGIIPIPFPNRTLTFWGALDKARPRG